MNATHARHPAGHDTQTPPTPRPLRAPHATPALPGALPAPAKPKTAPAKPKTTAPPPRPGTTRKRRPPATTEPSATTAHPRTDVRRRALGRYGEDLAARLLIKAGMRILARNWRCQEGEIDLVAIDGDALVICEVKTRRAGRYEHPMAAVRPEKTARLRMLAERWMERHGGPPPGGVRIDVIGVVLPARGAPSVEHVRGVA
ncbi:YraN family protein [Streptomyces endophytica]|uniref:UPF0102 protein OJ254_01265 n=1 Tax=Streptomyces endophytica TaxID=2991496 RepID=A0ABY6P6G4_9ACTN|nr:YraN family protein [Streptomyces endophytica]UZJ29371.1 YraN family protein [Streptomyces endophytica]